MKLFLPQGHGSSSNLIKGCMYGGSMPPIRLFKNTHAQNNFDNTCLNAKGKTSFKKKSVYF